MSPLESRRNFVSWGQTMKKISLCFLGEFGDWGAMGNGWVEKGKGARDEWSPSL